MKNPRIVGVFALVLFASSCGTKSNSKSESGWVAGSEQNPVSSIRPSASDPNGTSVEINVQQTLNKKDLFSQDFFFSADIQYTSLYSEADDLYLQTLALGHIPAKFKVVGNELLLLADQTRLYPSDLDHPQQLLSRFKIISETDTTLVVSGANSSKFLPQLFSASSSDDAGGKVFDSKAPPATDYWIRSSNFYPDGGYLLQETTAVMADGTIVEFMESIFPQKTLAPTADFKKISMDDMPINDRFRLLGGETIFDQENKVTFAQHYDVGLGKSATDTIDWYVTRNIPTEYVDAVGDAIEGWNRYFKSFKGIERDVVKFKGLLPIGIKVGDPRYNVVNWDRRSQAGAAYETQASDPFTGKQSHSLIYLPLAWINIGKNFWTAGGEYADVTKFSPKHFNREFKLNSFAKFQCSKNIKEERAILHSGTVPALAIDEFAVQLLKQTLFHEVGHALGLAHNFKGSLSYDIAKPHAERVFSTSIMDYNHFEIERGAFLASNSPDGPLLEYDRQAMSALYNSGLDIQATDPVLPVCEDREADTEEGGVDPLCVRYDVEKDPTHSISTAYARVNQDKLDGDITLADAIRNVPIIELNNTSLKAAVTQELIQKLSDDTAAALIRAVQFFYVSGRSSIAATIRTNAKSLLAYQDGILPSGFSEKEIRLRLVDGIGTLTNTRTISKPALAALKEAEATVLEGLEKTAGASHFSAGEWAALKNRFHLALSRGIAEFENNEKSGLPYTRARALSVLVRHEKVPYFFGKLDRELFNLEDSVMNLLSQIIVGNLPQTQVERITAAQTLATHKADIGAQPYFKGLQKSLHREWAKAKTQAEQQLAANLIQILQ